MTKLASDTASAIRRVAGRTKDISSQGRSKNRQDAASAVIVQTVGTLRAVCAAQAIVLCCKTIVHHTVTATKIQQCLQIVLYTMSRILRGILVQ